MLTFLSISSLGIQGTPVVIVQEASAHSDKDTVNLSSRRNKAFAQQPSAGTACKEQHEGKSRVANQLCAR